MNKSAALMLAVVLALLIASTPAYAATTFYLEVGGLDSRIASAVQEFRSLSACMEQARTWGKIVKQAQLPIVFLCTPASVYELDDLEKYPKLRLVTPPYRVLPVGP